MGTMRPTSSKGILERSGTAAFLVTAPQNVRYLSGVNADGGCLLITPHRIQLFVSALSRFQADQFVYAGIVVRDSADLARILVKEKECGFEADHVSVALRASWKKKFPDTKFVPATGVIEFFRRQKDEKELRSMRRAQRITREILRRVPSALRASITEEKLARQLRIWALELGADGMAFDPIVAFGTHTGVPHHVPGSRTLKKGHIVQIDVGASVNGYGSDMSRVFFTVEPTPLQKKIHDILLTAQSRAIDAARPGVTTHALDRLVREILRKHGLEEAFCHSLGHGVGLEIHEGVTLSMKRPEVKLFKDEVIAIEPGVYFPGKFGMRVEDMVFLS